MTIDTYVTTPVFELTPEAIAFSAYISHLDNCDKGCRPVADRGPWPGFMKNTGIGCPVGARLAAAAERSKGKPTAVKVP